MKTNKSRIARNNLYNLIAIVVIIPVFTLSCGTVTEDQPPNETAVESVEGETEEAKKPEEVEVDGVIEKTEENIESNTVEKSNSVGSIENSVVIEQPTVVIDESVIEHIETPPPIASIEDNPILHDNFKVILAVDEEIDLNEIGELRVWIGELSKKINFGEGMVQDQNTIPTSIGQYAIVTPYAPDFEISPSVSKCFIIDGSGSDVRFSIKPKTEGTFKVSANIEIFNSNACDGVLIPKTSETLTVAVKINSKHVIKTGAKTMLTIFWEKFLSFWGLIITLLFSVLFFVIRRIVKAKTGYDEK